MALAKSLSLPVLQFLDSIQETLIQVSACLPKMKVLELSALMGFLTFLSMRKLVYKLEKKEANSWGKRPPPYTAPLPATKVPEEKPEALLFCQDIQLSCHQTCLACGPEGRWEKEPGEDQDRHSLDGVGYPLQGF